MHILASTSNEKIFFDMLRNNDKITIYFILNYRHPIILQGVIIVNHTKCYLLFYEQTQKNELIAGIGVD